MQTEKRRVSGLDFLNFTNDILHSFLLFIEFGPNLYIYNEARNATALKKPRQIASNNQPTLLLYDFISSASLTFEL